MNLYDKKQKRKGYTLAEVLATVAILLILMAIAVPAIFPSARICARRLWIAKQS